MRDCEAVPVLPPAQRSEALVVIKNYFFSSQNTFHTLHTLRNLSPHGNFQVTCLLQKQVQFFFCQSRTKPRGSAGFIYWRTPEPIKCQWTDEPLRPYVVLAWIEASSYLTLQKLADDQVSTALLSWASFSPGILFPLTKPEPYELGEKSAKSSKRGERKRTTDCPTPPQSRRGNKYLLQEELTSNLFLSQWEIPVVPTTAKMTSVTLISNHKE